MEVSYLEKRDRIYHHFFLQDSFYHCQFIFLFDSVFFFETFLKVFLSFLKICSMFLANLFQGFSKIYPKVEVQNFPNFPFFPFFLLKSKVKLIFKIEVGVGGRFQKIYSRSRSRESISKNLESKSESGVDIQLIDIKRY